MREKIKFKRKPLKEKRRVPPGSKKKPTMAELTRRIDHEIVENELAVKDMSSIDLAVVERENERVKWLQMEWALFHPNESVHHFIRTIKGYSDGQMKNMLLHAPTSEWKEQRELLKNRLAKEVAQRHIDKIAKMNDEHIKAGRLGLAKGLQLLANGVDVLVKKTGTKFNRSLYPQEFQFVMNGLKTAQQMYRTSMGLSSDGEGMQQVLEELKRRDQSIQNNIQVNIKNAAPDESGVTELKQLMESLNREEIRLFVERKRASLKKEEG